MNIYGCIPASYFPSHSALTYWAQAASLAGLPSSDSALTSASLALSLKKSQLAFNINDVIQKSRSAASLRSNEDVPSSFRVATRLTPPSGNAELSHHGHLQLRLQQQQQQQQQQQHRQHQNQHHHLHHRSFSTPPPVGNGLAPLQALCDSDVSAFTAKSSSASGSSSTNPDSKAGLTFGMSRILSEDFGKVKTEKENSFLLSSVPESCRSLPLCPCNSASCPAYTRPQSPYPRGSLPSLSAVHALQPPNYPLSSSADALPGPYSILSTDGSSSNQPKRKRSWSRAVFSNLQRKGLEKRFEVQKYVTKPDRRQLAAMLGLTDAQVKVWFQNRRMKWRHAQQQGEKDKQIQQQHGDEEQQQGLPPIKQSDLKVETGNPADLISGAKNSEALLGAQQVFPLATEVTVKQDSNDMPLNLHGRLTATPPRNDVNNLASPLALPSDRCESLVAPFDTSADLPSEYPRPHKFNNSLYHDPPPQPNPPMTSTASRRSQRSSSSGADDMYSDVIHDYRMDSDDGSHSGLEIDSDVDMPGDDDINSNSMKDFYRRRPDRDPEGEHVLDDVSGKDIDVDN